MTTVDVYVDALHTLLAICAIMATWRFVVFPTLVAGFRQQLFEIRRNLFLFAYDSGIGFANPAYLHLRAAINGLLRSAEDVSLGRAIFLQMFCKRTTYSYEQEAFDAAIKQVDSGDAAKHLMRFRTEILVALALFTVVSSPIGWAGLVVMTLHRANIAAGNALRRAAEVGWRRILAADFSFLRVNSLNAQTTMQPLYASAGIAIMVGGALIIGHQDINSGNEPMEAPVKHLARLA
jgi:hypothetical protein